MSKEIQLLYTVEQFKQLAELQEQKGIKKYGQPLDPLDFNYDWLQMAEEEQVDGYKYLVAEQQKREFIIKKILMTISGNVSDDVYDEITFWLDALQGN